MTNKSLVLLAGSPSSNSRSSRLLAALGHRLGREGVRVHSFAVDSFEPNAILHARVDHPTVADFIAQITAARGFVVSSPVYKATYTGALKAIVDLVPYDALVDKIALGFASARSRDHLTKTERAYTELFRFFRVAVEIPALTLVDEEVFADPEADRFSATTERLLDERTQALLAALG